MEGSKIPFNGKRNLPGIFLSILLRKITIVDDEGYDEVIQYRFDDEGAEGFHETITSFKKNVPDELITYSAPWNIIQLTQEEFEENVDFALKLVEKGHTVKMKTKRDRSVMVAPIAGFVEHDPRLTSHSEEAEVDSPEDIAAYCRISR